MKFVRSLKGYDHLWAVRFNIDDLQENFHVRRVRDAIQDTFTDADVLEKMILGFPFTENLDSLFLPLSQADDRAVELTREKARNWDRKRHASWLRVYAIRVETNVFIITGGAIKLTPTMQDRPHTLEELKKMDRCRELLKSNGVFDRDSFIDYLNEEQYDKQGNPVSGTKPEQ